jgi:hypothetical protein
MITVEISDKSLTGKQIIKDLHRNQRVVNFVEPNEALEGYLTGDEFVSECISFVTEYYRMNGLL